MATSDELEDQLALTQKMNSVIERMAMTMSRVEQSYATQSQLIEKMATTLNSIDVEKANAEISSLTSKVKELATTLSEIGGLSEKSLGSFIKNSNNAAAASRTFNDKIKDSAKNIKNAAEAGDKFKNITKNLEKAGVAGDGMGGKMGKVEKFFRSKWPKALFIATAAAAGLKQGFDNIVATSKSLLGVLTSVTSTIFNVGLAIVAIPLKIFTGLVDLAADAAANFMEFQQAIEDLRKEFGDLKGPTSLVLTGLTRDLKGFQDTGLSAWRVFGDFAERMTHLREVATGMGAAFDSTRQEWIDNGGALLGFQKGLGLVAEDLKAIAQRAISVGKPMGEFLLDTTKQTLALGEAFGISQKVIGKDMAKAFQDMKHFAQLSTKEIGTAAVYARKLGVELDKITGTLDQFETFDSAAESAAKLTQSFGIQVDAFKLMEAQNPAEQIDMLRKSFVRGGVDVSNFNRQQLKLLSSTTGLDEATAKQVFSLSNQGASLDEIKKKSDSAQKKQLTQAEAMGKLADSIERLVKQQDQTGSFFDMFMKGVSRGLQSSKEFIKIITNIKQGLQQVFYVGVDLGRSLPNIMPGLKNFLSGISEFFDPKKYRDVAQSVSNAIKDYFSGKKSLTEALGGIKEQFLSYFSAQGPVALKIYGGFKDIFKFLGKVINDSIPFVANSIAKSITKLVEFIRDPKAFLKNMGGGNSEFGFFTSILMQTATSLKDAAEVLWPPLKEMFVVLFDKLAKAITEPPISTKLKDAMIPLAAMLFGPAIAKAGLAAFTNFLVKTTLEGLASSTVVNKVSPMASSFLGRIFGGSGAAGGKAVQSAVETGLSSAATTSGGLFAKIASVPLIASAIAMGNKFAMKVGASGIGSAMGAAVGLAAVAYIGIKGKQIIDEAFQKGRSADKNIQEAGIGGMNAMNSKSLEGKLKAIQDLKKTIQVEQAKLAEKGFGEKALNWIAGTDVAADQAANSLAVTKRTLQDLQEQVQKMKATGMKEGQKGSDEIKKQFAAADFMNPTSLTDAKDKIAQLENLGKKLMGKDFDLQKTINEVKAKFKGISFDIVTPQQAIDLSSSVNMFGSISESIQNVGKSFNIFEGFSSELNKSVKAIKSAALGPALKAVQDMIDQVNKMDEALSDGKLNTINVRTKLKQVASNVGLGSKAQYTIQSKPVNITVNLTVSMNAEDMEKALIMRTSSVIRDRLNFATNNPNDRGDTTIPEKPGELSSINGSSSGV